MTRELQSLNTASESDITGVEGMIHLRRKPRGYVPVIRFRQEMFAAPKPDVTITDRMSDEILSLARISAVAGLFTSYRRSAKIVARVSMPCVAHQRSTVNVALS